MKKGVLHWHSLFRGWILQMEEKTRTFNSHLSIAVCLFQYQTLSPRETRTCQLIIWCSFVRLGDLCYFFDEFMAVSHARWHGYTPLLGVENTHCVPCWSGYINSVSLKVLHYRTTCLLAVAMRLFHEWALNWWIYIMQFQETMLMTCFEASDRWHHTFKYIQIS